MRIHAFQAGTETISGVVCFKSMFNSLGSKIFLCSLACMLLGTASGLLTVTGVTSWYATIQKPSWNPPNWIFGPVWTLLYLLMGASFAMAWHKGGQEGRRMMQLFGVQFFLNLLWSPIFFYFHQVGWALVVIAALWILLFLTILAAGRVRPLAAWFLVPYISWVSFAMLLNATIWWLNR